MIMVGIALVSLTSTVYLLNKVDFISKTGALTSERIYNETEFIYKKSLAGRYVCDIQHGCAVKKELVLDDTGLVRMITKYQDYAAGDISDDDNSRNQESGTWDIGDTGLLTLTFRGTEDEAFSPPHILHVQSASSEKLSKFIFDKKLYTDMKKPIFINKYQ